MPARNELKQAKINVEICGKTVRKSIYYRTLDEYAAKKKKLLEDAKRQGNPTFKEIAERWQTEHDTQVQTYTANCYKRPVLDVVEEFGDMHLNEITSPMIQHYLDGMFRQQYAKQTINLRKIVLCQIFDYAIFHGFAASNPASVCKVPKNAKKTERELPSEADVKAIQANHDGMFGLYCNILLYTGMRREEALALSYDDIDFERGLIFVHNVIVFEGNKGVLRPSTKSKAGVRSVPILVPLREILNENGTGPMFFVDGNPIKKSQFDKGMAKYREQTGITATSHQLRHYFCTLCFEADLADKDLAALMGHSKVSMSKDIYAHIRAQRQIADANRLNALFK